MLTALTQSRGNIPVSIKTAHYSKARMYHILAGGLPNFSRQGLFYVPLLYLLPAVYGKTGIYLLQPLSDFLPFLVVVAVVYRWYRKNVLSNGGGGERTQRF